MAARSTAAAAASRTVRAWGVNDFGQLGDGSTQNSDLPVKVRLPSRTKIRQVRAGCAHTLALTSKGHVLAWGSNSKGQLGDGSHTDSASPVRVRIPRRTKITAIRAGCRHSLALTSKGHVLAWGYNADGQLGDGNNASSDTPVRVHLPKGTKVTAISAGGDFSLARGSRGHALAWGFNGSGQLGDGSTTDSNTPVRVKLPKGTRVKALAGGGAHSLALSTAGQLYAWGDNSSGQLGDGSTTSSDVPVRVIILLRGRPLGHVTSLFAGCSHSLAAFSHGGVLAWGDNNERQLGDGTDTSRTEPVRVLFPAHTKVTAVSAGCFDSYALTAKGHVLAWGLNTDGELGDGATGVTEGPVRVEIPARWRASAVGSGPGADHALAILHRR